MKRSFHHELHQRKTDYVDFRGESAEKSVKITPSRCLHHLADGSQGVHELLQQGKEEVSFRKTLSNYIAQAIVDRKLPLSIRVFTIGLLSIFILISFDICILGICAITKYDKAVSICVALFAVLCIAAVVQGFLLVVRLSALENAERLESGFEVIKCKKKIRSRGQAIA